MYAYAVGSEFDFQMNYYMSTPYGINPSTIGRDLEANVTIASMAAELNTPVASLSNPVATAAVGVAAAAADKENAGGEDLG